MKRVLLALMVLPAISFGQVKTSTMDGDFYNPLIWDDFTLPADGDTIVIDHDVVLNFGIPYTAGKITINTGASLDDGGADNDIYINGGSFENNGTLHCDGFWLDSGLFLNTGNAIIDSLWTRGNTANTGTMTLYDFLSDQNAVFDCDGDITVLNQWNNEGEFILNGEMTVLDDASNCNIQDTVATLFLYGTLCIGGDFLNCAGDTIKGVGTMYVAGASTNAGDVLETVTFHDPGGGFDLNTGNIAGTVTQGSDSCGIANSSAIESNTLEDWKVYPNPAHEHIISSTLNVQYAIYELSGRLLESSKSETGLINVGHLPSGIYAIHLKDTDGNTKIELIKKL